MRKQLLKETELAYLNCLKETGIYKSNNKWTNDNRCHTDILFQVFCEYCRLRDITSYVSRNFQDHGHFSDKQQTHGRKYSDINNVLSVGERKNVTRYGLQEGFLDHVSKTRYRFTGEE